MGAAQEEENEDALDHRIAAIIKAVNENNILLEVMEHKEQKENDKLAKEKEKRNLLEYWENKLKEG